MRVGAAKPETADTDNGSMIDLGFFRDHTDMMGFKVDVLVGLMEMQVGRNDAVG